MSPPVQCDLMQAPELPQLLWSECNLHAGGGQRLLEGKETGLVTTMAAAARAFRTAAMRVSRVSRRGLRTGKATQICVGPQTTPAQQDLKHVIF